MRGKTTIRVLMSEILRLGSYIKVKAILSERLTGKKASDTKTIYIRSYPERLIFSDSISSNFKPGLDYTMIVSKDYHVRNIRSQAVSKTRKKEK